MVFFSSINSAASSNSSGFSVDSVGVGAQFVIIGDSGVLRGCCGVVRLPVRFNGESIASGCENSLEGEEALSAFGLCAVGFVSITSHSDDEFCVL